MWALTLVLLNTRTDLGSHVFKTGFKLENHVLSCMTAYLFLQLAAQVLDEFDDEDIGVGLLDAKLDKAVAKKLGKHSA